MTVTSPNRGYPLLATGDQSGTWGVTINDDVFSTIDNNLSGRQALTLTTGTTTLSAPQAENFIYTLSGSLSGNCTVAWPATAGGAYIVKNTCTMGGFTITLKATGGTGVTIPAASTMFIYVNPTTTVTQDVLTHVTGLTAGTLALTTALPLTSGGTGATTAAAAASALGVGTGDSPQFTAVNIGAAADTTLTRVSAGVVAVEGDTVAMKAVNNAFTASQTISVAGAAAITVTGTTTAQAIVNGAAAQNRLVEYQTAGARRWILSTDNTAESGANAGSNFLILRYDDAGAFIATVAQIVRSTGATTWTPSFTANTFNSSGATITGGSVTGITDLAIADGGTGQSSAAAGARALLNGIGATQGDVLVYTGGQWTVLAPLAGGSNLIAWEWDAAASNYKLVNKQS